MRPRPGEDPITIPAGFETQVRNTSVAFADQVVELAASIPRAASGGRSGTAPRRQGRDSDDDITLEKRPLPVVVKTTPEARPKDVDPSLSEIRVTFSKDMLDQSWSWSTASKNTFPEVTGKIGFLDDRRTCVLPVKLEPGRTYASSINSGRFL